MSKSHSYHYHIRWSGQVPLDWESFASVADAQSSAIQIVRPGERYSIVKFDSDCVRCKVPCEDSLHEALARAIEEGKADFGNLQLLDEKSGALSIVAQQGFKKRFLEFFRVVHDGSSACGAALQSRNRVAVNDVMTEPLFKSEKIREVILGAGVRSVQSLPLVTSTGQLVGMISVHYRASDMPAIYHNRLKPTYIRDVADHLYQFIQKNHNEQPKDLYT